MILFTAAHHSREALSLSMIFNIFLINLKSLVHNIERSNQSKTVGFLNSSSDSFWDFNNILFVPAVNVDGVEKIDNGFHSLSSWDNKMVRKNLRPTGTTESCNQGVDLNRNYDISWDNKNDPETTYECSEVYRGSKPFSEPETQAIKNMVENVYPQIISAMNFHCYGNLWIRPPNFASKSEPDPLDELPEAKKLYMDFAENAPVPSGGLVTNAVYAVDYTASGEASDWFLLKKNIFSWSPELGTNEHSTDDFYIDQSSQRSALIQDYKAIEYFIRRHTPHFVFYSQIFVEQKSPINNQNKSEEDTQTKPAVSNLILAIENVAYASYKNCVIDLDFSEVIKDEENTDKLDLIDSIEYIYSKNGKTIPNSAQTSAHITPEPGSKKYSVVIHDLNRMEMVGLVIKSSMDLKGVLTIKEPKTSFETKVKYTIKALNPVNSPQNLILQQGYVTLAQLSDKNNLVDRFSVNSYNVSKLKNPDDKKLVEPSNYDLGFAILVPCLLSCCVFFMAYLLYLKYVKNNEGHHGGQLELSGIEKVDDFDSSEETV